MRRRHHKEVSVIIKSDLTAVVTSLSRCTKQIILIIAPIYPQNEMVIQRTYFQIEFTYLRKPEAILDPKEVMACMFCQKYFNATTL